MTGLKINSTRKYKTTDFLHSHLLVKAYNLTSTLQNNLLTLQQEVKKQEQIKEESEEIEDKKEVPVLLILSILGMAFIVAMGLLQFIKIPSESIQR